jgi:hypothetical protein
LFWQPYARVVVMHLTILVGGGVALTIGAPPLILMVMVVLKTGADLVSHSLERRKFTRSGAKAGG